MEPKETNPWFYAKRANHDYLTPEDIVAAINAGGDKVEVWSAVLDALGAKACEDWSLCAFVAHRYFK